MLMNVFKTFVMVFRYIIHIIGVIWTTLATLPDWIQSFIVITVAITLAYFLIGRNTGKSDK